MLYLVDTFTAFVSSTKVLIKLFQKFVGWRGNALLALRRARNTPTALLFCELFSCAYIVKRKAAKDFILFNSLYAFGLQTDSSISKNKVPTNRLIGLWELF